VPLRRRALAARCDARRRDRLQLHGLPPLRRALGIRLGGRGDPRLRADARVSARRARDRHFCPTCGCVAFWRATRGDAAVRKRIAVNLRLADPDRVATIPIDRFDGLGTFSDLPRDGRCVGDVWF
jgi:hypothetical protein